jgi:protein TonB
MKQITSRDVVVKRVEMKERVSEPNRLTPKVQLLEPITAPKPIVNAKVIPKETNHSRPSKRQKIPLAIARQTPRLDAGIHSSKVLRPFNRLTHDQSPRLSPPSPRDGEKRVVFIVEPFGESEKPPNREKIHPGATQGSYIPRHSRPQIVEEAVPDYRVNPKPFYPRLAVKRGRQGTVTLLVEVLSDGSAGEVGVFESSGHNILDRSARKAVQKWRFRPGTINGAPVTMKVKVPVVFKLKMNAGD